VAPADTIFALSTGQPPAAIAIVRVSGPSAFRVLSQLTDTIVPPRQAVLANLSHHGELLDRALVLRFEAPNTVTGEDLVELHLHGGRAVVAGVTAALAQMAGLRLADPGEFTRRAFANGRIDLAEAEGLADLLAAETQGQRRAALQLVGGALSRQVEDWRQGVLALAAAVEAQLDFSDESDVDQALPPAWETQRSALVDELGQVLARPLAERLRDGVRVVLAGPPNSGKSTLLNALAGREAAITSDIPGTTRDLVEAPVAIAGVPLLLIDSAGLRNSEDQIERIGVDRAQAAIVSADLVLWLGEPDARPDREGVIALAAKADLRSSSEGADLSVSAVTGEGITDLIARLVVLARSLLPTPNEAVVNARQRQALADAAAHLAAAGRQADLLIVAEELRQARAALDRITGRAGVEDMLDALFGRFCIGK
jgi:tRNA modification GTPase